MAELNAPKLPKGVYPELSPNPNEHNKTVFAGNETPTVPGNNQPRELNKGVEFLQKLAENLKGSEHIVVDISEDGHTLQVRLDKAVSDYVQLKEIDEADITVTGDVEGGAVVTTPANYFDPDATHHVILELETAGTHASASLDVCAYNGDVCFATAQINIGGTLETVQAAIQQDGSITIQLVDVELATTDTIRIKYQTYAE